VQWPLPSLSFTFPVSLPLSARRFDCSPERDDSLSHLGIRGRARINRTRSCRVNSHAWSSSIETEIQLDTAILVPLSRSCARIARKPIVTYTVIWKSFLLRNTLRDRKRFIASITLSISVRRDDVTLRGQVPSCRSPMSRDRKSAIVRYQRAARRRIGGFEISEFPNLSRKTQSPLVACRVFPIAIRRRNAAQKMRKDSRHIRGCDIRLRIFVDTLFQARSSDARQLLPRFSPPPNRDRQGAPIVHSLRHRVSRPIRETIRRPRGFAIVVIARYFPARNWPGMSLYRVKNRKRHLPVCPKLPLSSPSLFVRHLIALRPLCADLRGRRKILLNHQSRTGDRSAGQITLLWSPINCNPFRINYLPRGRISLKWKNIRRCKQWRLAKRAGPPNVNEIRFGAVLPCLGHGGGGGRGDGDGGGLSLYLDPLGSDWLTWVRYARAEGGGRGEGGWGEREKGPGIIIFRVSKDDDASPRICE